jgi:dGTPase
MAGNGGFEGNAQTLRILSVLEKKITADGLPMAFSKAGNDMRRGLNLTYRTLASILKYDQAIPANASKFTKGYYATEAPLVKEIKVHVAPYVSLANGQFKTIECQIMDIADDIAYSTYDLEDSFKAGFLTPLDMLAKLGNRSFREKLVEDVQDAIRKTLKTPSFLISGEEIYKELAETFRPLGIASRIDPARALEASNNVASNGYVRTKFTAGLVHEFVEGVEFRLNRACPPLSRAALRPDILRKVEILKRFTFLALIMSPRLQIVNVRGGEIVKAIFETVASDAGALLLPEDVQDTYRNAKNRRLKLRVICDFVASMTDRYAVEFYSRIRSANGLTIFKPH